jgi:hypothetical protein
VQHLDELHRELVEQGTTLGVARAKLSLGRAFRSELGLAAARGHWIA